MTKLMFGALHLKSNLINVYGNAIIIAPEGGYSTTRTRKEPDVSKFDVRPSVCLSVCPSVCVSVADPFLDRF